MKLTILYPAYFPSLLWWQKAYTADIIVLLDDQPNPRLSHLNRCLIKSAEGTLGLAVPVSASPKNGSAINALMVDQSKNWFRTHRASLVSNYHNAPFFEQYFPCFDDFFSKKRKKAINVYMEGVRLIQNHLRLAFNFFYHSRLKTFGRKEERVQQLLEHFHCNSYIIESDHQQYFNDELLIESGYTIETIEANRFEYEQQFGPFITGLSIIDALFNEGPYALTLIQGKGLYGDQETGSKKLKSEHDKQIKRGKRR